MAQLRDLLVTGAARFVNGAYFGGASTFGSVTQPIWWNNGFPQATTYSLSATLNAGSANRLAYYSGTNVVSPSAHYASATQLGINITNASTIGSRSLYVNGTSYYYDTMEARTSASHLGLKLGNTYLNAIDGNIIFQNNTAIRFGGDSWDWNVWAGLKYVHSNKKIVLGLADGTEFTANAAQSGGTFKIVGMSTVDMNKTASITNLAIDGGIYWNPYVESATDGSDAASITVLKSGAAGGTELRIQQQNDANDIINLVASKWIYLNGKRAFTINDAWLRINEDNLFTEGIYTGQSIVRTDAQFQVGDSGSKFYANSSGNGYFSNTLGIAGTDTSYNLFVNGTSRFNNTLYFFNSTGNTALSIESRRSKNSSNANIETNTGLVTKNKSFIEIRGFAPPTMVRTTGDRPAPYGLGFGDGVESAGIMPIGEGDNLRELMFYGANSGPTLFTWKYQTWESTSYDTDSSNGYSAAMMSLNSKTGDLYVKHSIGINGTNVAYKLYVNGESYFNGLVYLPLDKTIIQNQRDTSNYTTIVEWYKGGKSQNTYNPQIGQHNTGGTDSAGSITILPYATATEPWDMSVGLYITKNLLKLDGNRIPTAGSNGTVGSATVPVYSDGGVLKAITSYSGNAAAAHRLINQGTITAINGTSRYTSGLRIGQIYNSGYPFSYGTTLTMEATSFGAELIFNGLGGGGATGSGDMRFRTHSDWSTSEWGGWRTVLDNVNYAGMLDGRYVKKSGDTMTGDLTAPSVYTSNWFRSTGATGWYNESYNGGWYMTDATWVRSYASKSLYMGTGIMRTDAVCEGSWITASHDGAIQVRAATGAPAGDRFQSWFSGKTPSGAWGIGPLSGSNDMYFCFGTDANYNAGNDAVSNIRFGSNGTVWGAVWNDYAEFRKSESLDPGRVVIEDASGEMKLATERLQPGANIISDTYGFTIGETKENKTPIAVAGRVLAYTCEDRYSYPLGGAVCSGPNGTVSLMTREEIREYPERIIGTVSEIPEYETWGTDNVKVNGRIWIKVK